MGEKREIVVQSHERVKTRVSVLVFNPESTYFYTPREKFLIFAVSLFSFGIALNFKGGTLMFAIFIFMYIHI